MWMVGYCIQATVEAKVLPAAFQDPGLLQAAEHSF